MGAKFKDIWGYIKNQSIQLMGIAASAVATAAPDIAGLPEPWHHRLTIFGIVCGIIFGYATRPYQRRQPDADVETERRQP